MINYLLILFFSLSFRSANIENCPFDYEIIWGVENKENKISFLFERELGNYYWGEDISLNYKRFEVASYIKEAKKISSQRVSFLYPKWKNISIGCELGFKKFKNPVPLLTVLWKKGNMKVRYSRSVNRQNLEAEIKKDFKINDFVISPLVNVRMYDDKKYWQLKTKIQYNLTKRR